MATAQGNEEHSSANARSGPLGGLEKSAGRNPRSAAEYERQIRSLGDRIRRLDSDIEKNKAERRRLDADLAGAKQQLDEAQRLHKEAMQKAGLTATLMPLMGELMRVERLLENLSTVQRADALGYATRAVEARKHAGEARRRVQGVLARTGNKTPAEWSSVEARELADAKEKEAVLAKEAHEAAHNLYDKLFELLMPTIATDDSKLRDLLASIEELQRRRRAFDMAGGGSDTERRDELMRQLDGDIQKKQNEAKKWPTLVQLMGDKEQWGRDAVRTE